MFVVLQTPATMHLGVTPGTLLTAFECTVSGNGGPPVIDAPLIV